MLNDLLESDEIARQLRGFRDAGWGAVITRTFNGLRTEYLGEEWMAVLEQIVAQAAELGLKVWFQAGYMPSAVPDLPPELAGRALTRVDKASPRGPGEQLLAEDTRYAYVERRLDHVLDLLKPKAVDVYLQRAYGECWLPRFGSHFGADATIEAIWVDEPHFRPPLLPWSEDLPARFRSTWGYALEEHLAALFGPPYGVSNDAPSADDPLRVRHHYWRVVGEMLQQAYFQRVRDWCRDHDVHFSGHLMGEDTLNNQIAFTGAAMPCYEYMQLPGVDYLTKDLGWPTGKPFLLTPLQCASAAHQLGQERVLAEMYAVSSQGLTFEDRKQIAEWLHILGINYRCYHGSFYSLRGRRKRIYPPHLSHQQPWWPDNPQIARRFSRLSYALSQGAYRPDVLVLHPVESAFCLYDPLPMINPHDRTNEPPDVQALDTHLVTLCQHLLSLHCPFDLGDETLLDRHGKVSDGRLAVGEMSYRAVVLPDLLTVRASTLGLLRQFAAAGGILMATGRLPERIDGTPDATAAELAALVRQTPNERGALRSALQAALSAPEFELVAVEGSDVSSVWVHPRTVDGGRFYYLHNTDRRTTVKAELRLAGEGRLECWDVDSGQVDGMPQRVEEGDTVAALTFPPLGSHLLRFHEGLTGDGLPTPADRESGLVLREVPVLRRPRLERLDPNALTLDTCRYRCGGGPWSNRLPVLTVYESLAQRGYVGPVTLRFTFDVQQAPLQTRLVIEDADQYQIFVNGEPVQYTGLPYWIDRCFLPVEITSLVRRGRNVVELHRDFQPVPQARFSLARLFQTLEGTELEAIYLVGEFGVWGAPSPREPQPRCVRLSPHFEIGAEPETTSGDLVYEGYPFYAGRLRLIGHVHLEAPVGGERVLLCLPGIDAAALVRVWCNGQEAGFISWPPYELEITPLVQDGENKIAVELVSTLRNLFGPHHRPEGEPDQCWTQDYILRPEWLADPDLLRARWTGDYFFLRFGLPEGACVQYVKAT